jgi:hypothetical protein
VPFKSAKARPGHARTSSHERHSKKVDEISESVWLKQKNKKKTDLAPPWTFLANLDLRNATLMRRVATYFYYRIVEKCPRQDPLLPKFEAMESVEMNRMDDESVDNKLLLEMLLWFSTFRDAMDMQIRFRAKELSGLVNVYVRKPKQYQKEHAVQRTLWNKKHKRYGGAGKPAVPETLRDDKEAGEDEDIVPRRRTRKRKLTTQDTTAHEVEARQNYAHDSLPEKGTNQAPIFTTGTENIAEGADDSDVEMQERSDEEQIVSGTNEETDMSLWSTSIINKPIPDSPTAMQGNGRIEERKSQGSERSSSVNSTPSCMRDRRTQRESTELSSRPKSITSLEDENDNDDDIERSSSVDSSPPYRRGRRAQGESTEASSRLKSTASLEDTNNDDDDSKSSYASEDLKPHVSD